MQQNTKTLSQKEKDKVFGKYYVFFCLLQAIGGGLLKQQALQILKICYPEKSAETIIRTLVEKGFMLRYSVPHSNSMFLALNRYVIARLTNKCSNAVNIKNFNISNKFLRQVMLVEYLIQQAEGFDINDFVKILENKTTIFDRSKEQFSRILEVFDGYNENRLDEKGICGKVSERSFTYKSEHFTLKSFVTQNLYLVKATPYVDNHLKKIRLNIVLFDTGATNLRRIVYLYGCLIRFFQRILGIAEYYRLDLRLKVVCWSDWIRDAYNRDYHNKTALNRIKYSLGSNNTWVNDMQINFVSAKIDERYNIGFFRGEA